MEKEIQKKIRKAYEDRCQQQREEQELKERLHQLEEDPTVKAYLEAKLEYQLKRGTSTWTEDGMVSASFMEHRHEIKTTNGIMVCIGSYQETENGPKLVAYSSENVAYRKYADLEKDLDQAITVRTDSSEGITCRMLEEKYPVIIPPVAIGEERAYYYQLQKEFVRGIISEGQEKTLKKILN